MAKVIYVSHPEVAIDPKVPVPEWGLSPVGRARMERFANDPLFAETKSVWSSTEAKARDGAAILAAAWGLEPREDADLGENDRSATGYVAPPRFWELVDAFFAQPDESIEGWETARAAQTRIMTAFTRIGASAPTGDVAVVAHGGVGALALAALNNKPISRSFDQQGQGNWFSFDRHSLHLLSGWAALPSEQETELRS